MKCLVAGAGGFIGGHLVKRLLEQGHTVRAVDIKPFEEWWQQPDKGDIDLYDCHDLRLREKAFDACRGRDQIFNLAADMGGIGFIENNKVECMLSVLINTHLLLGAREAGAKYFYASSACVYHADCQANSVSPSLEYGALKEEDAYWNRGAMPEDGYGWEKLFSERMCRHFHEDYDLETRVARFHNIYGPHGTWEGGREKAPAAICRKVAEAKRKSDNSIDIWGDGTITRSFCWIGDCIDGILRLMESNHREPLNIGSSESVTINELTRTIAIAAQYSFTCNYDLDKPQGVSGRNSDNTLCKQVLGWEPVMQLIHGIWETYSWIEEQVNDVKK